MIVQVISGGIFLLLLSGNSLGSSWRGIVPLKSTKADVERLLGKPDGLGRYESETERAYIYYTTSPCDRLKDCECLVPIDTVLYIVVEPLTELRFSKLRLKRTDYQRKASTHLPGIVSYSNLKAGIIYTVEEDVITEISYLPSDRDCQRLLKKEPTKTRT